ncbi:MAG: ribonuclease HI [Bacteroidetes bacterium]|nr:ribonuclease HI [Bacteroidota bacterium]MDA0906903.1 ribonuclease HI [Bacteroidota bacterium]
MKTIILYTDGACSGNPGPGGWAALLMHGDHEKMLSGADPNTTNNRMEMMAVIEGLRALQEPCLVRVHSDSAYIINAFTQGWIDNWIRRGWKKADKKPVENQDLWRDMMQAMERHTVEWVKVKGHSDDVLNQRVDEQAVMESKRIA